MEFSAQLRTARITAGLTQRQVADAMGITNSTYCGYETGKREPDVAKIKQLSKILKVPADELLDTGINAQKHQRLSGGALQLARNYDELDAYGQRMVRMVADEEKARCTAARSAPNPELHWLAEELEKIQPTLIVKGELDDIISLIMKCVQGLTLDQQRMFLAQLQALIEGQIEAPPSSVQQ